MKRAGSCILAAAAVLCAATLPLAGQDTPAPEAPAVQDQAAGAQDPCRAPESFTHVEGRLARVAIMVKERKLDILVVGTGSSGLGGPQGARMSYPMRLEVALGERLPGVAIAVRTDVRSRRTAADMAKTLQDAPVSALPGLVVWQTGTVDAIRGIDPDEFREALEAAVKRLQGNGIDVLLVNMQYSPRTQGLITAEPYAEAMRWVAQQTSVPLFDRLGLMQYWSENGVFDFTGADRTQIAERVHDCIGRLMAELIIDAAGLKKKAKHN